jgi:hypothetical protein
MKTLKISLKVIATLIIVVLGYFFVSNDGFRKETKSKIKFVTNLESPFEKDLTFGVKLNCLPTVKVKSGLKTFIVYDEGAYETADQKIYKWFQESMENNGGEGLAKMRAEIKLMETVYEQIQSAERLTTDGTPEQKLLMMEKQIIAKLHDALAQGSNMNLQYGFN